MAGRKRNAVQKAPEVDPNVVAPNALVASAVRLSGVGAAVPRHMIRTGKESHGTGWYAAAWGFYDEIGEFHFAVNWLGNMISRAQLYVGKKRRNGPGYERAPDSEQEILDQLIEGTGGQAEMLHRMGLLMAVPGDSYLLGWNDGPNEMWKVASPGEVTCTSAGKGTDRQPRYNWRLYNEIDLGTDVAAVRIWRPHPNDARYADSPTRATLPILSEISLLTQHVAAQATSRLAGAGMLVLPQEMDFPADKEGKKSLATLLTALTEAMTTPIQNRADPSSLVPLLVTAPGELLEKIQHITFWSGLDEHSVELRTEAIRRLALGLDMPPEVLTGVGDVNHWQAWAIDESAVKVHATPPLELIVSSLTVGHLQPNLADRGVRDTSDYAVLADTSQMRTRPNRSKEALELYDRGRITSEALLREVGFDPEDAMGDNEFKRWLLVKIASGSTTPEQVVAAARQLGVELPTITLERVDAETQEARPTPSLREHPQQGPPEDDQPELLVAVAESISLRALERAGNRIKNRFRGRVPENVGACELHVWAQPAPDAVATLLEDAWSTVPALCDGRGINAVAMADCARDYVTALLTEHRPHDRARLAEHVARYQLRAPALAVAR